MDFTNLVAFDYHMFNIINSVVGRSVLFDEIMMLIAKYGPLIFDGYLIYLWFKGRSEKEIEQNRKRAIYAATSAFVALSINQIVGLTWFRERPYIKHPVHMLLPYSPDPSFPSDHAAGAFSIALGVLYSKTIAGSILFLFAIVLAIARVYVGLHYPFDVVGGALIGMFGSVVVEQCKGLLERPVIWVIMLYQKIEDKIPMLKSIRFQ